MFNNYSEEKRKPLQELYDLMVQGGTDRTHIKRLKQTLRGMGMLSLPFSTNKKKFKELS